MIPDHYRVPFDDSFKLDQAPTLVEGDNTSDKALKKQLKRANRKLYDLQRCLYAHNRYAVLLIFQAMDAAGKDSTIRHVMRGVNPAGCQVFSFKQPSSEELDHDFLWRSARRLPERGRIGIFNRSYYEETLVVRVHPEYLANQRLPGKIDLDTLWIERFQSIRDHERHLAQNGTRILKFFLNVSAETQKQRFLKRLDRPDKNWKFSRADVRERQYWNDYMAAYEHMLNQTSRPDTPWYAIPADSKPHARVLVAQTIIDAIENLGCEYPQPDPDERAHFDDMRQKLMNEGSSRPPE